MLIDEIKKLGLDGDISTDEKTIKDFSHDASLFEVRPEIVVAPKTLEDIEKLVRFASEHKLKFPGLSLTPRAAGTCMSGGSLNTSIILDFKKYYNRFLEMGSDFAVAEPGLYYHDFEKKTLERNLLLPPYPASREICAIGGMVGNNGAGEKTLTHGKIEDYVEELDMVLSDGKTYTFKELSAEELKRKIAQKDFEGDIYRKTQKLIVDNYESIKAAKPNVSKNSAGYYLWNVWNKETGTFNLNKLFVGAQGTLGINTRVKFRLVKPVKNSKMLVIFLKDLSHLTDVVSTVLPYKPETFESYDDQTLKLAIKFLPELIKIMRPKNLLKLGIQFLPELWMTLTGGFPKLILMAEFTGDDSDKVLATMHEVQGKLNKFGLKSRLIRTEEEAKKYWVIRHESFNLLRHHIKDRRTAPFIDDVVVRPEFLPQFLPELNALLAKYNLIYTIAGHVGDGNFHIIPLMDMKDPRSHQIIAELSDQVYPLVLKYHGSITAEHNDGLIRSPYLKQMYGPEIYALFEEIKKIFDPQNIFNPGKKVNSSMQYAMDHMVKE